MRGKGQNARTSSIEDVALIVAGVIALGIILIGGFTTLAAQVLQSERDAQAADKVGANRAQLVQIMHQRPDVAQIELHASGDLKLPKLFNNPLSATDHQGNTARVTRLEGRAVKRSEMDAIKTVVKTRGVEVADGLTCTSGRVYYCKGQHGMITIRQARR